MSDEVAPTFDAVEEAILAADELTTDQLETLLIRAGRNYGPALLDTAWWEGKITTATLAAVIGDVWSANEYPDVQLGRDAWLELFHAAGFTVNGRRAERPSEPVQLYRGATYERRLLMSWTTRREVAERFAAGGLGGRSPGVVWTTLAPPETILCVNHGPEGRNEDEYVIDPVGLDVTEDRP